MWNNAVTLFRLSCRLYFAPLVGAWKGAVAESNRAHAELLRHARSDLK